MNGTLIFFNPDKRHGFIRTEDGERLLVREDGFAPGNLLGDRCAGTRLEFDRIDASDEAHAANVTVVPLNPLRRARRRGR